MRDKISPRPAAKDALILLAACLALFFTACLIYFHETGAALWKESAIYCPAASGKAEPSEASRTEKLRHDTGIHVSMAEARDAACRAVRRSLTEMFLAAAVLCFVCLIISPHGRKNVPPLPAAKDSAFNRAAATDPLTGLLNRKALYETGSAVIRLHPAERHAFFMIDLDNFKKINDTFGHIRGDMALRAVAERITAATEEGDLAGRIGGDEFIILTPSLPDVNAASAKAEALLKGISGAEDVTASVGIALYPQDGTTFEELYNSADIAMYRVKKKRRNSYEFYSNS